METTIGKKIWAIAEGYIPSWSNGPAPEFTSHEAACILNAGDKEAHMGAQRTLHLRFNNLEHPERIPLGLSYSSVFISDVPVVIQHTRLDSRQEANALLSTIAYSE